MSSRFTTNNCYYHKSMSMLNTHNVYTHYNTHYCIDTYSTHTGIRYTLCNEEKNWTHIINV